MTSERSTQEAPNEAVTRIEQSIKDILSPFVFAPNDGRTWSTVVAMVSNYLRDERSQGVLLGATAAEAFTVGCGVGSTMTEQDVRDGYLIGGDGICGGQSSWP